MKEKTLQNLERIHAFEYGDQIHDTWAKMSLDDVCAVLRFAAINGRDKLIIDGSIQKDIFDALVDVGIDITPYLHPDTFCPFYMIKLD